MDNDTAVKAKTAGNVNTAACNDVSVEHTDLCTKIFSEVFDQYLKANMTEGIDQLSVKMTLAMA